ncbi:MAG: Crp/Fnr family transcriptional regulator [Clostridia bacterium]|nr:Crp/Fnr family transcriptional regulator [Clostridia bacterium]
MVNPFAGISELQKTKLFKLLQAHIYKFNKNEEIIPTFKSENIICILLEGQANIYNISYNGEEYISEKLFENSVFGTNISGIDYNEYQIRAIEPSTVLVIQYKNLMETDNLNHRYFNIFFSNVFEIITKKLRDNNNRIKILTKKSIREKLLAYFENSYKISRSKHIYLETNFKDLADYLSINKSAMFRELRNLKDEHFIKVDGKRITLLYTPNV